MPPRKRFQYRRPPRRSPDSDAHDRMAQQALDATARHLATNHDPAELRRMAQQTREAYEWADRAAQQDPSPEALRRFRAASRSLAELERALSLAED